jgi:superfamily II DNA or RNA helicase
MTAPEPDVRRRFTRSQRRVLADLADGQCESCGAALDASFHADHKIPHSRGGRTDVANGDALCPTCNAQKGNNMNTTTNVPVNRPLTSRPWQGRLLSQLDRPDRTPFLVAAAPGAGKTMPSLQHAKRSLASGEVERVVVLTPTTALTQQWAVKAHELGLTIDPRCGSVEPSDLDGVALTYQALVFSSEHQRALVARRRTLVIADEVHHLGEHRSQGDAFRHAAEPAAEVLLLSGTPFRSDENPIPYVNYDGGSISVPDFTYSYGEAIRDGVCRRIVFEKWDGPLSWGTEQGVTEATFGDVIPSRDVGARLRTALQPELAGLRDQLTSADRKLSALRQRHPEAGGLVIAMDIRHAERVAELLAQITSQEPELVTSDDSDANSRIEQFAASDRRWIVAVNMVSEGVDVPRLRVGVYASNVTTPMRFRQIVGRFVRVGSGPADEPSYLFLPADDRLVDEAKRIEEEIAHEIEGGEEEPDAPSNESDGGEPISSTFTALKADMQPSGAHADGVEFPDSSTAAAAVTLSKKTGLSPAEIMKRLGPDLEGADAAPVAEAEGLPRHVEIENLGRERKRLCGRLFHELQKREPELALDHKRINGWANSQAGIRRSNEATLEERRLINEVLRIERARVIAGEPTRIR